MTSSFLASNCCKIIRNLKCQYRTAVPLLQVHVIDPPDELILEKNNYRLRPNEDLEKKKQRLMYQSRKRGMLENDLLLSTFAAKFLSDMNEQQVDEYDKLINLPSNEWDLFNWALKNKPVPPEFNNGVMQLLQEHTLNTNKEQRFRQPNVDEIHKK